MPDSPTLLDQLASRAKSFHSSTGISQTLMAKAIGMEASNYNAFLQGRKGLGAESTCLLLQFIAMPKREVIKKFSQPVRTSKILNLQQSVQGQPARMRLDNSGWYPSTDGSGGVDPLDSGNAIDNTPDADTAGPVWDQDLIDTLRSARAIHRKICRTISAYINKAKANAGITVPSGVTQKFGHR